jgi:hypothetical protein
MNRQLFRNGVLAQNIVFMLNGPLSSDQVEEFYKRLEARHGGAERANRPMVVDMGMGKVESLGFSNREMEFFQRNSTPGLPSPAAQRRRCRALRANPR